MAKRKSKSKRKKKKTTQSNLEKQISELLVKLDKILESQQQNQDALKPVLDSLSGLKTALEQNINPIKLLEDIRASVIMIANDNRMARQSGFHSGVNLSVIKNELERLISGQISFNELINVIDNVWNMVRGYTYGDTAFNEVVNNIEKEKREKAKKIADELEEEYDWR